MGKYVTISIGSTPIMYATSYKWSKKKSNDSQDTFDGPWIAGDPFEEITVDIENIISYNADLDKPVQDILKDAGPNGLTITCKDHNVEDIFTGCYLESQEESVEPKSARTSSLSFNAKNHEQNIL